MRRVNLDYIRYIYDFYCELHKMFYTGPAEKRHSILLQMEEIRLLFAENRDIFADFIRQRIIR